jgi:hypothetical protein
LVISQVEARGVRDPLVLAAMKAVRRELFGRAAKRSAGGLGAFA